MAGYDNTTLKMILEAGIGGVGPAIWHHTSTDDAATVDASGFITDGGSRGMKVGDIVLHTDSDASPPLTSSHTVVTVSSTYPGAVDLSNGVTIGGGSNSD